MLNHGLSRVIQEQTATTTSEGKKGKADADASSAEISTDYA